MKSTRHAQAAWLDRSGRPDGPPRLHVYSGQLRAPISFGRWAMTAGGRLSKYWHVETLYTTSRLEPSSPYGMDAKRARDCLESRHYALLHRLTSSYRWIGPTLIADVGGEPR